MAYRTRIFVDFWNFSLQWRDRANGAWIDWQKVPRTLLTEGTKQLEAAGLDDGLHLEETLVYASYMDDERGRKLKGWLDSFLDKQPSFRVQTRERRRKGRSVHCRECDNTMDRCPSAMSRCVGRPRRASTPQS
jgi:hypothetical protein